ncbi:ornithine carbamoyltransferase [Kineosphaera limosa]|uniref:Ornithine carbamoyltransferase n=1 Tax=Kineosphaera limosa NBRC 100340 TaxID=1184609 RepID=K6VG64_9MICO|nr:ornithine carbamoyltransferase [Kineosphaera limosa]NYE01427.1 ornithine carbamoyltransferase [Kineosphaera limosa]GAB95173.1 ornithine carbamoyltransferase [Kineosphaera limosa NBRC 100340]
MGTQRQQTLRGRSFLREVDFTAQEWRALLGLAASLKAAKKAGTQERALAGANIALLFEKTSTRTRCAFEVASYDLGAHVTYLDPTGSQLGHKESVADTARVLGRMYDGIQYRGSAHSAVETLARHAGVPVWNGLTDDWHPTQSLCDALTMREHCDKPDEQIVFAYVGDARNNVANSLLAMAALMGMDARMVAPGPLQPAPAVVGQAREIAAATGARLTVTDDVAAGLAGVDFVHTDVWVSMGEPTSVWDERIELLRPYRVDAQLMARAQNPDVKFMHCLPAYHDRGTDVGAQIADRYGLEGVEVTDEVFESPASIVFDQAENRLHTIKAVLVATLCD